MYRAEVRIGLKKGVADPEGANTHKTLKLLGFEDIREVHTVKLFTLDVDTDSEAAAKDEVERACRRLLANPVIHDYQVTLQKA
ncbi:MAG: phosphoribosylformylglycinamidine synthase subunit PurS [Euryarchaeota archaeon]|nr:phosphoribosylformylglycinamidine synthase subunit PurS [Euryarchaeota archaeon]